MNGMAATSIQSVFLPNVPNSFCDAFMIAQKDNKTKGMAKIMSTRIVFGSIFNLLKAQKSLKWYLYSKYCDYNDE